jgi:hypothetical protein
MNNMWLTPEILEWRVEAQGGSFADENQWKRPYDIWAHAEQVLSHPTTEFLRVDVITTLKRAIDHRVRMLNNLYSFKRIPIKEKPSEILNLLEFAGVVRPLMLQKLLDIRNAVEHEDASPPDHESCQMFLEFAWYFLRSTDKMAQQVLEDFGIFPPKEAHYYGMSVYSGPENSWIPKLWGWITPDMLSNVSKAGWIVLDVEEIETREELTERLKDSGNPVIDGESGRGRYPNDMCISAKVRGPSGALIQLLKMYFAAV